MPRDENSTGVSMPTKTASVKAQPRGLLEDFHVEALQMRFANGVERDYERLLSNHQAVIICPMLDDDRVILARSTPRAPTTTSGPLPKGKLDPGEDYTSAANRELQEEIGYAAEELILLKTWPNPQLYAAQHPVGIGLQALPANGRG